MDESETPEAGEGDELLVSLHWNAQTKSAICRVGTRTVDDVTELEETLRVARAAHLGSEGDAPFFVVLRPLRDVPWANVVKVMSVCERAGVTPVFIRPEGRLREEP